jgi:hypothetical protein
MMPFQIVCYNLKDYILHVDGCNNDRARSGS